MKITELNHSEKAFDIATTRPKSWELLLFAQLLDEEVIFSKNMLQHDASFKVMTIQKFSQIRTSLDLISEIDNLMVEIQKITDFSKISGELSSSSKNQSAFGPEGKPGDAAGLKMLARRVGNLYYEIGTYLENKISNTDQYNNFLNRNIDLSSEKLRLFFNVFEKGNELCISGAKNVMSSIEKYSSFIQSRIQHSMSGSTTDNTLTINVPDTQNFMDAVNAVNAFLQSEISVATAHGSSANESSLVSNSGMNEPPFASLYEFISWLSTQSSLTWAEMRNILLPFDLFPSAVVNDINERALEITGEMAVDENSTEILINQSVLLQISSYWSN